MQNYLENVPEDLCFRMGSKNLMNEEELLAAVRECSDNEFRNYVGDGYNHFASWIKEVIKDADLAESLVSTTDRNLTTEILEKRVKELKAKPEAEPADAAASNIKNTHEEILQKIENIKKELNNKPLEEAKEEVKPEPPHHDDKKKKRFYHVTSYRWSIAREFWYGIVIGIIIGLVLSELI